MKVLTPDDQAGSGGEQLVVANELVELGVPARSVGAQRDLGTVDRAGDGEDAMTGSQAWFIHGRFG